MLKRKNLELETGRKLEQRLAEGMERSGLCCHIGGILRETRADFKAKDQRFRSLSRTDETNGTYFDLLKHCCSNPGFLRLPEMVKFFPKVGSLVGKNCDRKQRRV